MNLGDLIEFHKKRAELNYGKEMAARKRRLVHEATVKMLSGKEG